MGLREHRRCRLLHDAERISLSLINLKPRFPAGHVPDLLGTAALALAAIHAFAGNLTNLDKVARALFMDKGGL